MKTLKTYLHPQPVGPFRRPRTPSCVLQWQAPARPEVTHASSTATRPFMTSVSLRPETCGEASAAAGLAAWLLWLAGRLLGGSAGWLAGCLPGELCHLKMVSRSQGPPSRVSIAGIGQGTCGFAGRGGAQPTEALHGITLPSTTLPSRLSRIMLCKSLASMKHNFKEHGSGEGHRVTLCGEVLKTQVTGKGWE